MEYFAYIKMLNGSLVREYSSTESGITSVGDFSSEEITLGFNRFPQSDDEYSKMLDKNFNSSVSKFHTPVDTLSEDDILSIAKAWTVDPTFSDREFPKSIGVICSF